MRRLLLLIGLLFVPAGAGEAFELTILHTNDLHARLPQQPASCLSGVLRSQECFGPFVPLARALDQIISLGGNTIFLDAGDQCHEVLGAAAYSGRVKAGYMNLLGYDAMTLGNHEFDFGETALANYVRRLNFSVLAANLRISPASDLVGLVRPYKIVEVRGRKVGIIGLLNREAVSPELLGPDLRLEDPAAALSGTVAELESRGVKFIILLSHLGLPQDRVLAETVPGVDVIVGGHSHLLFSNEDRQAAAPYPLVVNSPRAEPVLIVSTNGDARFLGRLVVEFNEQGRPLTWEGPQSGPLSLEAFKEPPWSAGKPEETDKTDLGIINTDLPAGSPLEQSVWGNILADALLWQGSDHGVSVGLYPTLKQGPGMPAGPLTRERLLAAVPGDFDTVRLEMSGTELRAVLEHSLSLAGVLGDNAPNAGLYVAGLTLEVDLRRLPGQRLLKAEVRLPDGGPRPLDPGARYLVSTIDWLALGGAGFPAFWEEGGLQIGPPLWEVMLQYLPLLEGAYPASTRVRTP